jgi:phosphoribosyl-AMP cyclohydrolase / phosphoribosyl-ATP pyrophosphohydrolase
MNLNWEKYSDGLVPAIVQDSTTGRVLMLGFMNAEALDSTRTTGRVTFYSRTRKQLWTKGESSGNFLELISMTADCDADTLLINAKPHGPVCHTGNDTCFSESNSPGDLIAELEAVIADRRSKPDAASHVSRLFEKGLNKIAQKVGEEAVEVAIAAKDEDLSAFKSEAADLLFHFLILLQAKGTNFQDILDVLQTRRNER